MSANFALNRGCLVSEFARTCSGLGKTAGANHDWTYVLIIIDPTYKLLFNRDENKAGDIASLMNEFEMVAVRTGAAVAFGAHYSKGNQSAKEPIDRIGGSGVFARDPDSILSFTRHEEPDCFTVEMNLRNHPPQNPFVVRWEFPLFAIDSVLDPNRLKQAGGRPRLATETKSWTC